MFHLGSSAFTQSTHSTNIQCQHNGHLANSFQFDGIEWMINFNIDTTSLHTHATPTRVYMYVSYPITANLCRLLTEYIPSPIYETQLKQ